MTNIIEFDKVIKEYKIDYSSRSIRGELSSFFRSMGSKNSIEKESFQAVKCVSFKIPRGNTIGLIGSNGSGKSTILKLMSKVTYPTSGKISINGSVASLLEIGAGFHQDFTARENIYLNGAVLGLSRKQINQKFDEIVAFSELEKFIDTPIKKYSSGMYVKLGFSIAIHVNPDILLVDEVLSVGDAHFQNKCIKKMREVISDANRTVIIVSHNMVTIQSLCNKVLWFEKGIIRSFDETKKVISLYSDEINKRDFDEDTKERLNNSNIHAVEIGLYDYNNKKKSVFYNSEKKLFIKLKYKINKEIDDDINISFFIDAVDLGITLTSASTKNNFVLNKKEGVYILICCLDISNIYSREISLRVIINSKDELITYDSWDDSCRAFIKDTSDNNFLGVTDIFKTGFDFSYE